MKGIIDPGCHFFPQSLHKESDDWGGNAGCGILLLFSPLLYPTDGIDLQAGLLSREPPEHLSARLVVITNLALYKCAVPL